ncbi:3',5'-cyclic AMP phosphodiesterase CpdA [Novosphingobium fluoreni]|uniref:3',5'-cyclic AMP phosphodiesterase CpdA n=1 Tax=Novosphingobium fluoreni TaxID=1391222 RepID=A0A7W6BVH6_9SPHN|nr:metallophosphoesterase [Novosphingobium fluoreni]KTR84720.1 metallophosphoesterase [Novosphingobium barchaimii]MBB3938734.1 3',5'-cyclic AMP phosphodiesterase CpdA [Novosphingobium fluoreni]
MRRDSRLGPIKLFHISDIHFGLEDPQALDWVEDCIASERPDAVVVTGDLTMRARHKEFVAACKWISSLDVPVTVEIGNHDMPYFNPIERFLDPYKRFRSIEAVLERELDLGGLAIVPLKTTARAQWRTNWSKGWITRPALKKTLAMIDALPEGTPVLISAHHPLVEVNSQGSVLTKRGGKALEELAKRKVLGVMTGHVHDPFDLIEQTAAGPVRMIGAGTLSRRVRSTPPSFNQIIIDGTKVIVEARNLAKVPTPDMQIDDVPENALPPRRPEEPVSPVAAVPREDPPVR